MKVKAYAKINLALGVVGKREDGYHLLEMIMQNIDLYDEIIVEKQKDGITITCDKPYVPADERNIAYKAAELFINKYNINSGVTIDITKNIPVAAGLAGGSTDGAAVLKAMNEMFDVNASDEELMDLGVKLGADVPYCINGGTALCEGIGEKLTPLKSFKDVIIILVKPPFGVSTKEVYGGLDISKINKKVELNDLINAMENKNLEVVSRKMRNHLENVTLKKHKILIGLKKELVALGAVGAMMSGSGPSVFAIFDDMMKAQKCYDNMKKKYKEVFITRTI